MSQETIDYTKLLFNSMDACKITGATYRQLDHWITIGLIEPRIPSSGSGSTREFDYENLINLKIIWALYKVGIKKNFVETIVKPCDKQIGLHVLIHGVTVRIQLEEIKYHLDETIKQLLGVENE